MKPLIRYDFFMRAWALPDYCWTTHPERGGYSARYFWNKTRAKKALKLYRKLGRCLTIKDVEDMERELDAHLDKVPRKGRRW